MFVVVFPSSWLEAPKWSSRALYRKALKVLLAPLSVAVSSEVCIYTL